MPSILVVRVISARDLPVMNRTSELTDAYVELRFADHPIQSTEVVRKSLNPVWNSDFRFEINDDQDLMMHALEVRCYDYDTITANDIVGTASINLNPLISNNEDCKSISGYFPIYDTLKGIRGAIQVHIKLDLMEDRLTSVGRAPTVRETSVVNVIVFNSTMLPFGYNVMSVDGFIEELIMEDDPEYHWKDSFRTNRASNEARQRLLFNLTGKLRRLLARKALGMGCNAIVGYRQCIDLEGEWGIVMRGVGTACRLIKTADISNGLSPKENPTYLDDQSPQNEAFEDGEFTEGNNASHHTDEDENGNVAIPLPPSQQHSLLSRKYEVQFLTLESFPPGVIVHFGSIVSARSVKLLTDGNRETRDKWWTELRDEIRFHASQLGCPFVVGYNESYTVSNELCILSAYGTAVHLDLSQAVGQKPSKVSDAIRKKRLSGCRATHIPYHRHHPPFMSRFLLCQVCGRRYVPDMLLSSIEPPPELYVLDEGALLQAYVCRAKRHEGNEEDNADSVGDALPFMEYELHRQLVCKLKLHGFNGIFGLRIKFTVGEELMTLIAYGTGMVIPSLPLPTPLQMKRNPSFMDTANNSNQQSNNEARHLAQLEKNAIELSTSRIAQVNKNCETFMSQMKLLQRVKQDKKGRKVASQNAINVEEIIVPFFDEFSESIKKDPLEETQTESIPSSPQRDIDKKISSEKKKKKISLLTAVKARLTSGQDKKQWKDNVGETTPSPQLADQSLIKEEPEIGTSMSPGIQQGGKSGNHVNDESNDSTSDSSSSSSGESSSSSSSDSDDDDDEGEEEESDDRRGTKRKEKEPLPLDENPGNAVFLDDKMDGDLLMNLLDVALPVGITASTLHMPLALRRIVHRRKTKQGRHVTSAFMPHAKLMTLFRRFAVNKGDRHYSRQLAQVMHRMLNEIIFSVRNLVPCHLCGIEYDVQIIDHRIQILYHATILVESKENIPPTLFSTAHPSSGQQEEDESPGTTMKERDDKDPSSSSFPSNINPWMEMKSRVSFYPLTAAPHIDMTTLPRLANARIDRYLGRLSLTLIKESNAMHETGGIGYFTHYWMNEIYALARTHVGNTGGNAVLSLQWHHCLIADHSEARDHAYCMMSLTGDIVYLTYDTKMKRSLNSGVTVKEQYKEDVACCLSKLILTQIV